MILQPEKNRNKDKGELISHLPAHSSLWKLKAFLLGIKSVELGRFGMVGTGTSVGFHVDPAWDRIWGVEGVRSWLWNHSLGFAP